MSYATLVAALPADLADALGAYAQGITASEVVVQDARPTLPDETALAWWRPVSTSTVQSFGQQLSRHNFELRLMRAGGTRANLQTWLAQVQSAYDGAHRPDVSGLIAAEVSELTAEDDEEVGPDVELACEIAFLIDPQPEPLPVTGLAIVSSGSENTITWNNPAGGVDMLEVVVRRASGSVAPAAADEGTGVTLGSALAETVVDDPGYGEWSYAVFVGYDTDGDAAVDVYSAANTATADNPLTVAAIFGDLVVADWDASAGVTEAAGEIASWTDQHAGLVASGASNRPAAGTVGANVSVRFAVGEGLSVAAPAALAAAPVAVVAVVRVDTNAASVVAAPFYLFNDAGPTRVFEVWLRPNLSTAQARTAGLTPTSAALTPDVMHAIYARTESGEHAITVDRGTEVVNASGTSTFAGADTLVIGGLALCETPHDLIRLVFLDAVPTAQQLSDWLDYVEDTYGDLP